MASIGPERDRFGHGVEVLFHVMPTGKVRSVVTVAIIVIVIVLLAALVAVVLSSSFTRPQPV